MSDSSNNGHRNCWVSNIQKKKILSRLCYSEPPGKLQTNTIYSRVCVQKVNDEKKNVKIPIDGLKSVDSCSQIDADEVGLPYRTNYEPEIFFFNEIFLASSSIKLKFSEQLTQNPFYFQATRPLFVWVLYKKIRTYFMNLISTSYLFETLFFISLQNIQCIWRKSNGPVKENEIINRKKICVKMCDLFSVTINFVIKYKTYPMKR